MYTVGPWWLPILHTAGCLCQPQTLFLPTLPPGNHKFVLYHVFPSWWFFLTALDPILHALLSHLSGNYHSFIILSSIPPSPPLTLYSSPAFNSFHFPPFFSQILLWLCWVFIGTQVFLQVQRLKASLKLLCVGFSMGWLFLFQSVGFRARTFRSCNPWALEHRLNSCGARLSCYAACGIFQDQGLNPCLLHWQVMLYHWATREALHVPFYQTLKNRLSGPTFPTLFSPHFNL